MRTLIAEETRVSMLIGVAVGYELAHTADRQGGRSRWQWTSGGWATRPSSSRRRRERARSTRSSPATRRPRSRRTSSPADVILLTHGHGDHHGDTVDIAKRTGATVVALIEIAAEIEGRGSRTSTTRTSAAPSASTGAGSSWSPPSTPSATPERHGHPPAGLLVHYRRHARLPPGRHRAVLRPAADRAAAATRSTSRWCRSAATSRWTATTRSPPSSSSTPAR